MKRLISLTTTTTTRKRVQFSKLIVRDRNVSVSIKIYCAGHSVNMVQNYLNQYRQSNRSGYFRSSSLFMPIEQYRSREISFFMNYTKRGLSI